MKIRFFQQKQYRKKLFSLHFFGIYHLCTLSKPHSNWINGIFIKTQAARWWTKNIIIFKNLGASLYAKLLLSTKTCLEATEYSHKHKISNDPSFNVNFTGKYTKGTSMLQKISGNLILTKPFLYANKKSCRKIHLKNTLLGNNTQVVFPQSVLRACQLFIFLPKNNSFALKIWVFFRAK